MSYSTCIHCQEMVGFYEKYCNDCVQEHNLKQDDTWHRTQSPNSYKNSEEEFQKDIIK